VKFIFGQKNYEPKDNFDIDLAYGKGLSSKEKPLLLITLKQQ
jgi:hypothetical protein